ncbi:uncharacterized protein A4U43_C06F800 [Asparagus officinalis]|uniref:Uncharacterized protein n=1 Tax=Asparagus officinalis TaxID=4686 RepID=A0A5P1EP07_ASPOF|nr:uncharacterized protein A4U43_C06F800 [Asparagus officinalis]
MPKLKSESYIRLADRPLPEPGNRAPPKGFVPILVGLEPGSAERVLVKLNRFKDPRVVTLLEMAENELGCRQQGVLRVNCDASYFRQVVVMWL